MGYTISTLITEEEIEKRVRELGAQITEDYKGKDLHMICILKGACFFMTDLAKRIEGNVTFDFMSCSSYGAGTVSSGVVTIEKDLEEPVEGRDIMIVEDIIDTGRTLSFLKQVMEEKGARSIRIATLLDKPDRRVVPLKSDYVGFVIPDEFVVGYGLDFDQVHRNLPYIGIVRFDK